jgi:transposase
VKVHVAVSSDSFPLAIIVGPGNEHDSKRFEQTISSIRLNIHQGRPNSRPREVLADAAYDTDAIRIYLRKRGIKSSIPVNKRNQKKTARGRPTRFDSESYKKRGAVERFFGWLKIGFRRITISYERLDVCFTGLINLAAFLIIWRKMGILR